MIDNNNLNFTYSFNIVIKVLVLLYILKIDKIFFKKYFEVTDLIYVIYHVWSMIIIITEEIIVKYLNNFFCFI